MSTPLDIYTFDILFKYFSKYTFPFRNIQDITTKYEKLICITGIGYIYNNNNNNNNNMPTYELPDDLWGLVMSFFHSSYKRPSHYDAIMSTVDFRNKTEFVTNDERDKAPLFVSYYAHIIYVNWDYWSMPDLNLFRPEVSLTRGVAKGKTLDDFVEIWRHYKTNQHYYGQEEVDYTYIV